MTAAASDGERHGGPVNCGCLALVVTVLGTALYCLMFGWTRYTISFTHQGKEVSCVGNVYQQSLSGDNDVRCEDGRVFHKVRMYKAVPVSR